MRRLAWTMFSMIAVCSTATAQNQIVPAGAKHHQHGFQMAPGQYVQGEQYIPGDQFIPGTQPVQDGTFVGAGSIGSQEPLFHYDDQERWKHGYIKVMPYYHGFHSFRPYNYHHVFGQSTTAQGFGMSPVMPYSQQFWHRYEKMADLSQGNHEPVYPGTPPPKIDDHYPRPIHDAVEEDDQQPSARLMIPYQGSPQQRQIPVPQPQEYSQTFQGNSQPGMIAPARFQNTRPTLQAPALPAPPVRR